MKAIDVFFTTIFKTNLQPYLILATIGMTRDTFIKHMEAIMICEESGMVITNYNALIIQPESKSVAQPIVHFTMTKQPLTCSNYGKTGHAKETYHNRKKEIHVIHVVPTKVTKPIVEIITQFVKPTKIPLTYPYIICSSFEHRALDCFRKTQI